jgi:CheY-like chemotaxis protein
MEKLQPKFSILIVDDNPRNLHVLGKNLQLENYEIEFAINGSATIEWLNVKNFDLLLLDINMPGMNGLEVCRQIRSDRKYDNMPVIFITADADKESIIKGFEAGGQDYITKPFDLRELMVRVRTHLALKNSIEKLAEINSVLEERVKERTLQLNNAKEKAEESNRLKTAFLQNLSHELRTPMNGILGFLEILQDKELDEEKREEFLNIVQESGQRLLHTINDIVEISKIETGDNLLYFSDFDLAATMNYHLEFFKPKAEAKNIEFRCSQKITGDAALINSDSSKIEAILTNLINNAIKFTYTGSIEFGDYLEGLNLVLYVNDTGKGIPSNRLDAIFDRFVQADSRLTRAYEGMGLGLSIVNAYVKALGGEIKVESEVEKGSLFSVYLPYYPSKRKENLAEPVKQDKICLTSNPTVLVVDDDDINLQYFENSLKGENIDLIKVTSGEESVEMVHNNPSVSIVLMDIKMPGINGFEATQQIRMFNKELPIIAQTAYAMPGDKERAFEAGCNDYITKPIARNDLLRMIQKYC